jgi:hypothetical protein
MLIGRRPTARASCASWSAVACLLLAGIVGAVDLPVVHDHHLPGIFNEECPLGRLAARAPRLPSPDVLLAAGLPVASPATDGMAWIEPAIPVLLASTPRAPPTC